MLVNQTHDVLCTQYYIRTYPPNPSFGWGMWMTRLSLAPWTWQTTACKHCMPLQFTLANQSPVTYLCQSQTHAQSCSTIGQCLLYSLSHTAVSLVLYAVDKGLRSRNVLHHLLLILLCICSRSVPPIRIHIVCVGNRHSIYTDNISTVDKYLQVETSLY